MELSRLLSSLPSYQIQRGVPTKHITALAWDSRRACPGSLFVAYRGVAVDGHAFILQAFRNGARCIVAERPIEEVGLSQLQDREDDLVYIQVPNAREALAWLSAAWHGFPARQMMMVGVTGTDGKTTTVHLLYHILRASARRVGMISTVSAVFGDRVVDTGLHTTTPDAFDVQRLLADMAAEGIEVCILEATSHGLAQHRVTACEFDVAVVTNITHDHLDLHGSLEAYRAAKARLFAGLSTAARKPGVPKIAVLNRDDSSYVYLRSYSADVVLSYGQHPHADVRASQMQYTPNGIRLVVESPWGSFPLQSTLVGAFNVDNILAATTAGLAMGVPPRVMQQAVGVFQGVKGRMERVECGQPFTALIDFAHTPNSLRQALQSARSLAAPGGRVIVVFGCAGMRDVEKREMMGRAAAELADYAVLTAEDPRTESLDAILEAIAEGCRQGGGIEGKTFERIPDRGAAIARGVALAQPGDVLLVCGKGHERSMCFGDTEYEWDDRAALTLALRGEVMTTLPTACK
ncbi:MAG: UDP-N-acetylmuramoyl-L-alanyl-D-glutamate--2,6-diaminopimelate ligase [Ardenticatenia bacterium]|jgi:UDP-N-acetylmuramoyl-L-alanyl-D-glutamate--2,6-diaminopimelate ligase|nr:MAG: UDP-N-acetylmuramoyl-L-alanyl-D-glutamate--2,6-diaminopimelate ligase [Ardenticatenia bacterium]